MSPHALYPKPVRPLAQAQPESAVTVTKEDISVGNVLFGDTRFLPSVWLMLFWFIHSNCTQYPLCVPRLTHSPVGSHLVCVHFFFFLVPMLKKSICVCLLEHLGEFLQSIHLRNETEHLSLGWVHGPSLRPEVAVPTALPLLAPNSLIFASMMDVTVAALQPAFSFLRRYFSVLIGYLWFLFSEFKFFASCSNGNGRFWIYTQ